MKTIMVQYQGKVIEAEMCDDEEKVDNFVECEILVDGTYKIIKAEFIKVID